MATGTLIRVRDLSKTAGGRGILRGVSLDVPRGGVVSVLGPSGSGKTTLLRCMDLLMLPDGGSLEYEDGEILDFSHRPAHAAILRARRRAAFVFQGHDLFLNMTVLRNVAAPLTIRGVQGAEAEARAMAALERVGMAGRANEYPSALSGGQRQRVGIARAIVADPEVVFLDEPTSALDPKLVDGVLDILRSLAAEGRTMVLATHQIAFARDIASHAVFLVDGKVEVSGPSPTFFDAPSSPRLLDFLAGK